MYMCCTVTVLYCIAIPSSSHAVCQQGKDHQYKPIVNEVSPSYFSLVLTLLCVSRWYVEKMLFTRDSSQSRERMTPLNKNWSRYTIRTIYPLYALCTCIPLYTSCPYIMSINNRMILFAEFTFKIKSVRL